jgi:hypothetical protein
MAQDIQSEEGLRGVHLTQCFFNLLPNQAKLKNVQNND